MNRIFDPLRSPSALKHQMTEYTEDTIWGKDVRIIQPKNGYRFGIDAVLLTHFLKTNERDEILEIGTGSGVIPVLLSRLKKFQSMLAIEIQKELAEVAAKNVAMNEIRNVEVIHGDIRTLKNRSFNLIFCNPPYRKTGSGKLNPNPQKAIARHELNLRLEDIFECVARLLKANGRLTLILPSYREGDLIHLTETYKLHLQERRYVHSFSNESPAFILATLGKSKTKLEEHPHLVIYDAPGIYSKESQHLLNNNA